jgi:hypothetical protein
MHALHHLCRPIVFAAAALVAAACDEGPTAVPAGDVTVRVVVEGQGLQGVSVELSGEGSPRSAVTGSGGEVDLGDIPAGLYTVRIENPDPDLYAFLSATQSLSVIEDRSVTATFEGSIVRESSIAGAVLVGGAPLEGAEVRLTGPEGERTAPSDASGAFGFTQLRRGTYTVSLTNPDPNAYEFAAASSEVQVARAQAATLDFIGEELPPVLVLDVDEVALSAPPNGVRPRTVEVAVTNGGGGVLGSLQAGAEYGVGEPTGWIDLSFDGETAPTTLTMVVSPASLSAGSYTATVRASGGADGPESSTEAIYQVRLDVEPQPVFGYAWAPQPSADLYEIGGAGRYAYTSAGTDIEARRVGVGEYRIVFPGMGDAASGAETVLVSAYGDAPTVCGPAFWGDAGDLQVTVRCHAADGSGPVDSRFTILAVGEGALAGESAFAWTSSAATDYEPNPRYAWNSLGGPMRITLPPGADTRTIDLAVNTGDAPTSVFVSRYGGGPEPCMVADVPYPSTSWRVACREPSGNTFVDARFTTLLVQGGRPGRRVAFATTGTPDGDDVPLVEGSARNSHGDDIVVTRIGPGRYEVTFEGQATPRGGSEVGIVSALGTDHAVCNPIVWVDDEPDIVMTVGCWDAAGAPVDSGFSVLLVQ